MLNRRFIEKQYEFVGDEEAKYDFPAYITLKDKETGKYAVALTDGNDNYEIKLTGSESVAETVLTAFLEREKIGMSPTEAFLFLDTTPEACKLIDRTSEGTPSERINAHAIEKKYGSDLKEAFATVLENYAGVKYETAEKIYDRMTEGVDFCQAFEKESHQSMDEYQKEALVEKIRHGMVNDELEIFQALDQRVLDTYEAKDVDEAIQERLERNDKSEELDDVDPFEEVAAQMAELFGQPKVVDASSIKLNEDSETPSVEKPTNDVGDENDNLDESDYNDDSEE